MILRDIRIAISINRINFVTYLFKIVNFCYILLNLWDITYKIYDITSWQQAGHKWKYNTEMLISCCLL